MLDIVRIRKEGFPVHVPAEVFVEKYHAMAQVMKDGGLSDLKKKKKKVKSARLFVFSYLFFFLPLFLFFCCCCRR